MRHGIKRFETRLQRMRHEMPQLTTNDHGRQRMPRLTHESSYMIQGITETFLRLYNKFKLVFNQWDINSDINRYQSK